MEAEETQIRAEIDKLAENYHRIVEYSKMRYASAVCRVHPTRAYRHSGIFTKKDLTESIVEETVEDGALYKEVQTYLETEMPDELPLLRAYTDPSYPLVKMSGAGWGGGRRCNRCQFRKMSEKRILIFRRSTGRRQGKQSARSGSAIFPVSLLLILST